MITGYKFLVADSPHHFTSTYTYSNGNLSSLNARRKSSAVKLASIPRRNDEQQRDSAVMVKTRDPATAKARSCFLKFRKVRKDERRKEMSGGGREGKEDKAVLITA